MQIHVVTGFPKLFSGPLTESIIKRARERKVVEILIHDLRDYTTDKHRTIDDYPYGGGPGMILKPEPIFACLDHLRAHYKLSGAPIILMSPQGERFTQRRANELARLPVMVFICGHYKGVDERVREHLATEELSIGDYIVTGGELPAMVVIDAVIRLLPGVLGDWDSASGDSFQQDLLDYPHYTRPEEFRGLRVPEVLISGHHAKIAEWRKSMAEARTRERRADLLKSK
ncbi:MAG: tRNA (guanosine(37)-N1)-methyltransferase TrmD [candidate division KSB1 bacterium]|nr:tRNA (guanosine(37)-N1)-methyltransferase TrmD [candidate division KSB1 bacterium]MDZ7272969.1 tRNA (guanosine(37)-N1)-methyltransferase TrmD [candidate division KSB1 bacterium]MDZ7285073.1 tRNA (guanosine(37)-N1)-methyltransferase TrmD [candidate division KSB1 bacterium]MDZ7298105.1 tRNA (guanosine(37)-N1)-methyltransferase TrmD [candidate division KSB1 bacterium]MDZ7308218.1 tRNA (guanosine(37)-N1)-methyltransferase TrmD [candidate division KSB1 bacterium]